MDTTEIIRGLMQQRDRIDAAIAALSEVDVSQQPPVRIRRGRAVGAVALAKKVLAANGNRPMHALDIYDAIAAAGWTSVSARPAASLTTTLAHHRGFEKVGPSTFRLANYTPEQESA